MCDFRASGLELLDDQAGSDPDLAFALASYRAMARVHRLLGFRRDIDRFLEREAGRLPESRPLRVLDMGAGDCSLAIQLCLRARQKGIPVAFTCVDSNPCGLALAKGRLRRLPDLNIQLREERMQDHVPDEPYDCALGNLFLHHFSNSGIRRLLRRLRPSVRKSVLITDLRRGSIPFLGFALLAAVLPGPVCRDGLLSIRRGFTPDGFRRLLHAFSSADVSILRSSPFSITARIDYRG